MDFKGAIMTGMVIEKPRTRTRKIATGLLNRFGTFIKTSTFASNFRVRSTERALMRLSDRQLQDIGLSRSDIPALAREREKNA
ncbi:DUF1127 domain-containing protein [Thalassospira xianhensis]|uniref:YjiS-like domain-containing protein n=2 Tax=Thalassospira TaxID=168934 RepID=A0A285TXI4_9PROT|nr:MULTISPECIES: DUF1127 domain-containing protein [Thalassospira]RCK06390.1 hypothetical protein TH5_09365 [Thalassospira xianhensis MCCC 1A02616]SOC30482.1 protein of unknown function [Thalassospira xiamenensis]